MAARRSVDPADPVGSLAEAFRGRSSLSVMDEEPIRTWLLGLAELKVRYGQQLAWSEISIRIAAAAKAVVDGAPIRPGDGGKPRPATESERAACAEYAAAPRSSRALSTYIGKHHPDLFLRLKKTGWTKVTREAER